MFWEAGRLNPCWTLGWAAADGWRLWWPHGPGSHQGMAMLQRAGAGGPPGHARSPAGLGVLAHPWCLARRVCSSAALPAPPALALLAHSATSEDLRVSHSGGRADGYSLSLPKRSDFPRTITHTDTHTHTRFSFLKHQLQNIYFDYCWEKHLCQTTPNFWLCIPCVSQLYGYVTILKKKIIIVKIDSMSDKNIISLYAKKGCTCFHLVK